ncbi:MAG: DUF1404 domain-containing protein [Thermoproteota archaeon]|nr:DUF1404 domain-containing protein [Thermoproteota archaeon]
MNSYLLFGTYGILVLISLQSTFLEFTEQDLAYHMIIEHSLFFVMGTMSVQIAERILKLFVSSLRNKPGKTRTRTLKWAVVSFWTRLLRKLFTINRFGYVWIAIAVALLTFWHIPTVFDFAELHESIHILQHISFIVVGAAGFLTARSLGESFKLFVLFALNGIMGFAGLMFSVLDRPVYLVYSVNSHNNAGTYMLVSCIILLLVVLPAYLIRRTLFHMRDRQSASSFSTPSSSQKATK